MEEKLKKHCTENHEKFTHKEAIMLRFCFNQRSKSKDEIVLYNLFNNVIQTTKNQLTKMSAAAARSVESEMKTEERKRYCDASCAFECKEDNLCSNCLLEKDLF